MNPLQLPFLGLFVSAPSLPFEQKKYVGSNGITEFRGKDIVGHQLIYRYD